MAIPRTTRRGGDCGTSVKEELRKLKILLVNKFYFVLGGTETYLFQLEELLKEKGHSVLVFSTRDPRNRGCDQSRFFVEKIDYNSTELPLRQKIKFGMRLLYSLDSARKMEALVREQRPDIAHLHSIYHQISPSVLPVLRRHRIPTVQTLQDLKLICPSYRMLSHGEICERCRGARYYHAIVQRCVKDSLGFSALNCVEAYLHKAIRTYEMVDLYISPSEFYKRKFNAFGVDASKIRVLPNIVQLDVVPSSAPGSYVLYCGRLGSEKGVVTLVKAMAAEPHIKLVIAGRGQEEIAVRRYIREKGIINVEMLGFVAGEEKRQLIRGASFLVVPSEWYENCSLSVLEGFAHGKPVVGARIGGIPEQVKPGYNGLLFEAGNVPDLREKIRYLAAHPEEVVRMGRNARRSAEESYSPESHYRQLMAIYGEAISLHRPIAGRRERAVTPIREERH